MAVGQGRLRAAQGCLGRAVRGLRGKLHGGEGPVLKVQNCTFNSKTAALRGDSLNRFYWADLDVQGIFRSLRMQRKTIH